jgi:hypothetical protein
VIEDVGMDMTELAELMRGLNMEIKETDDGEELQADKTTYVAWSWRSVNEIICDSNRTTNSEHHENQRIQRIEKILTLTKSLEILPGPGIEDLTSFR